MRAEGGRILADGDALLFHGDDVAHRASDGTPVEFIRDEGGAVRWIRVNGQGFARKQAG